MRNLALRLGALSLFLSPTAAFSTSPKFIEYPSSAPASAATAAFVSTSAPRDLSKYFAVSSPEWIKTSAIYEVSLRAFPETGKLYELEDRLMKLGNSGFDAICLAPIFPIGEENRQGALGDPRAVKDFLSVNYEFGTKDGLKSMIAQSRYAKLKIFGTWPIGTTSRDHAWVKDHPDWYLKDSSGAILGGDGSPDLALLDFKNADVQRETVKAMMEWASAFDLDGCKFENADAAPAAFWEIARKGLRKVKKDFILIGVTENPEAHLQLFDVTLSKNVYAKLKAMKSAELDPDGLEKLLADEERRYPQNSLHARFIEEIYGERAASAFGAAHRAMAVLNLSLPGVAWVVTGEDAGFADPISRTGKTAADWKAADKELLKFYKRLLKLRREHPALARGQIFRVKTSDESGVFAYARTYRDDAVLIILNLSGKEFKGTVEVPGIFKSEKGEVELKAVLSETKFSESEIRLPAWGAEIFEHK